MILKKVSLFGDFSIKKRNARRGDTSGGEGNYLERRDEIKFDL